MRHRAWGAIQIAEAHLDDTKDSAVGTADAEAGQASQDGLSLLVDLFFARQRDDGKVGGRDRVENRKERIRLGGGREQEEADRLVVEFRDSEEGPRSAF